MREDSAVRFATNKRIHVALAVKKISESIVFYRTLFGQEPTKLRPGYAKFEIAEPPVNLALNESVGNTAPSNPIAHFGIQVKASALVGEFAKLLAEAGLKTKAEEEVTCCYALQDKIWVTDPDGNQWEIFVVLNDEGVQHQSSASDCCSPGVSQCCAPVEAGSCTEAVAK